MAKGKTSALKKQKKQLSRTDRIAALMLILIILLTVLPILTSKDEKSVEEKLIDEYALEIEKEAKEYINQGGANLIYSTALECDDTLICTSTTITKCDEVVVQKNGNVYVNRCQVNDSYIKNNNHSDEFYSYGSLAETDESCFDFDLDTGTIYNYYAYQNNDPTQEYCPTDVVIPRVINRKKVKTVSSSAFNNKKLTSVVMQYGIISIEANAFANNLLTYISIPNSVINIETGAFNNNHIEIVRIGKNAINIEKDTLTNNPIKTIINGTNVNLDFSDLLSKEDISDINIIDE